MKRKEAIIMSMTPQERKKPDILAASRKRRIAAGAGVDVAEVNKVLKEHRNMADMMKKIGKGGMKGLAGMLGGNGRRRSGRQGPQVNQQQINALKNLGGGQWAAWAETARPWWRRSSGSRRGQEEMTIDPQD
jgi:signal recognition particle GTPase